MNDQINENEADTKPIEQKSSGDNLYKLLGEMCNWLWNTPIASIIFGVTIIMWYDLIGDWWTTSGKTVIFWLLWSRPVGVFLLVRGIYVINENEQDMKKQTDKDDYKFMIVVFLVGVLMVIWGYGSDDIPSRSSSIDGLFFYNFIQPIVYKFQFVFWVFWNRYLGVALIFFSLDRILLKGWIEKNINIILSKFSKSKTEETE